MNVQFGSEHYDDLSKLNSKQLDKIYETLQLKTREVYKLIGDKLIEENRENYLHEWVRHAGLSLKLEKFFLANAVLNDFVLENGYYHYISKYGADMTFQVWSCRWLLEEKGDYVSYLKKPVFEHMSLRRKTLIKLEELERMDLNDPKAVVALTEFVIYKAVENNPGILCITKDNRLFGGKIDRHFTKLDRVPR